MLLAILVIVSFILLVSLVNTAILLLLGSALVQLIEKSKAIQGSVPERERNSRESEKPWYAEM
jgi:hypothetical protein